LKGKRIAAVAKVLGMQTIVAERKGAKCIREDRVSFEDLIRKSTVIVIVLPRTADTVGLIGKTEIAQMSPSAVLVNVSRGGIVDEAEVVAALQTQRIAGAAFDVYAREPAGRSTSPLFSADAAGLNLLTTPHSAWLANSTMVMLQQKVRHGVEGWFAGQPVNVVN
jgi:lactate dehydrogenase-like 2-hydroxyacid dehydrogenase